MTLDTARVRRRLKRFDFESLFIEELGWDNYTTSLPVDVDEQRFTLQAVAEKRGVVAFVCAVGTIPPYPTRRKIERQVARSFREHFIIYVDGERTEQIWQWVRREAGRPLASREHHYTIQQPGDSLIQKLQNIAFSFEEEETLPHVEVTGRLRAAFNVERATKKFYDRFKKERDAFQKFLAGIPDEELERWYVSVMLNRLMFIYFIQKKGFLDSDPDYLRHKLAESEGRFYANFLCPLFFEGFARTPGERSPQVRALLGDIPFLNGGIFQQHEVEQLHGRTIRIPDAAFERLFDFFDYYQWHLDDRPLRDDREINPDVLGYIFEKYINQKQMGAYYTKEDITGYISQNTIIPFLFDQARDKCRVAFEGEQSVWALLAADPDRYFYEAVRKGADRTLPPEIAAGIDDVSQRGAWNTRTPEEYALPTEIWRETVARRQRYEGIWLKLVDGEVRSINDLITYNLDIRQFAQDVIENCEGPELLRAFWQAIKRLAVLDITCGSGAFLFAALNILEPLYEACLGRMEAFVAELAHGDHHPHRYKDFREVLEQMERHPNRSYFVLKSIVVNNLYGVDIMSEAVEIAKLRLFLKLVAQVGQVENVEPLPDIDFNIRAGNTLVGFTTIAEVERAMKTAQSGQGKLMFGEDVATLQRIEEKAEDVDRLFEKFQAMQTAHDMREYTQDSIEAKEELRSRFKALREELNSYLAREYGVDVVKPVAYQKWLASHQPFHWFIEFYGILKQGGFDVIIGNPPFVQYSKVRKEYQVLDYTSERSGNLCSFVMERAASILEPGGRLGLIVPISVISTKTMISTRKLLLQAFPTAWASNFAIRPSKLFEGVEQRLTIYLATNESRSENSELFSTKYLQWYTAERPTIFFTLEFSDVAELASDAFIPKAGSELACSIIQKTMSSHKKTVGTTLKKGRGVTLYFHRTPGYWIRVMDFEPYFRSPTSTRSIHHIRELSIIDGTTAKFIGALTSSSLYFFWFFATGNCRNLTLEDVKLFPVGEPSRELAQESSVLFDDLMADYQKNSFINRRGSTEFQEFDWGASKPIVDRIDRVMAQHYSLTEEELDFVINYDIKIRLGDALFRNERDE